MLKTTNSLLAMVSVLAFSACVDGQKTTSPGSAPMESVKTGSDSSIPSDRSLGATIGTSDERAALYTRLTRLESDVMNIKGQIVQLGPILEKMPALQDKLSELVAELQRIDARVASAQAKTQDLNVIDHPSSKKEFPEEKGKDVGLVKQRSPSRDSSSGVKTAPAKGLLINQSQQKGALPLPVEKPDIPKMDPTNLDPGKVEKKQSMESAIRVDTDKKSALLSVASKNEPATLKQIRVGDYPDKTRVVLDLSQKVPFVYDLDNSEKIMIVDVDTPQFSAAAGLDFSKSPLVAAYTAQVIAGGKSRIILQLRVPVEISKTQALPPNGEKGDRIVIDLIKAD